MLVSLGTLKSLLVLHFLHCIVPYYMYEPKSPTLTGVKRTVKDEEPIGSASIRQEVDFGR